MKKLTFQDFLALRDEFDAAVSATSNTSKFCNSSGWIASAFLGLHEYDPESQSTFIVRDGNNWLVFVEKSENYFYPFESAWMFGSPLIGPESIELFQKAKAASFDSPKGFVFGGLPKDGEILAQLKNIPNLHFESFPATDCMIIDLTEGVDSWLARRSKKFRRTIRDSQRKCTAASVMLEEVTPDFERMLAIQKHTAKWKDGSDIFHNEDCVKFYSEMLNEKSIRLRVALIDGKDVAFLLGAVFGNTFRGLQMSYDNEFRTLGLGNFLQIDTMRAVSENDGVTEYDLGMFSEYKSRWADEMREFVGCFIVI